jgi:uncharacterized membrane-anchored protein
MLRAPLRIMIVAGVCVLGLIGLVVREGYERSRPSTLTSRDVQMEMQAVDPRALLSGHYVIVNLRTTLRMPGAANPCVDFAAVSDHESWVALADLTPPSRIDRERIGPPPFSPIGVAATRDAAQQIANRDGRYGLAVRGSAYCSEQPDEQHSLGPISVATVQTQLAGVQRFYAPQGEAERIDGLLRNQTGGAPVTISAIVNVGRDGRARLKGLNVNGEIIELSWL